MVRGCEGIMGCVAVIVGVDERTGKGRGDARNEE